MSMPGNTGDPSLLLLNDSASALVGDIRNVTPSTLMLLVTKCWMSVRMSASGFAAPAAVGAPFVILAGDDAGDGRDRRIDELPVEERRDPGDHFAPDDVLGAWARELDQFLGEHDDPGDLGPVERHTAEGQRGHRLGFHFPDPVVGAAAGLRGNLRVEGDFVQAADLVDDRRRAHQLDKVIRDLRVARAARPRRRRSPCRGRRRP